MNDQLTVAARDQNRSPLIHGATHLLDCPADELPLTEAELFCQFGSPIVVEGIDVSAVMRQYLAEVSGQEVKDGILPDLKTLASGKRRLEWLFGFRLLIEFDRKSHLKAGMPNFKYWVTKITGRVCSGSAISRGKAHARVALVFAAAGLADSIPSQNTAMILQRHLPRKHWVDFWRQTSTYVGKRISAERVEIALQGYADINNVRMLKPITKILEAKQPELFDEQTESSEKENTAIVSHAIEQIRVALKEDSGIGSRAARALIHRLAEASKVVPNTPAGKHARKLAACIRDVDPVLADRLLDGLMHILIRSIGQKRPKRTKRKKSNAGRTLPRGPSLPG